MISQTVLLYGSAAAVVGMLILFARNNRKSGWKKSRTTLADAFQQLCVDLGLGEEQSFRPPVHVQVHTANFSAQLVNLRGALGSSTPVTIPSANPMRETERVAERVQELVQIRQR